MGAYAEILADESHPERWGPAAVYSYLGFLRPTLSIAQLLSARNAVRKGRARRISRVISRTLWQLDGAGGCVLVADWIRGPDADLNSSGSARRCDPQDERGSTSSR
jgi:hypothetical protein